MWAISFWLIFIGIFIKAARDIYTGRIKDISWGYLHWREIKGAQIALVSWRNSKRANFTLLSSLEFSLSEKRGPISISLERLKFPWHFFSNQMSATLSISFSLASLWVSQAIKKCLCINQAELFHGSLFMVRCSYLEKMVSVACLIRHLLCIFLHFFNCSQKSVTKQAGNLHLLLSW